VLYKWGISSKTTVILEDICSKEEDKAAKIKQTGSRSNNQAGSTHSHSLSPEHYVNYRSVSSPNRRLRQLVNRTLNRSSHLPDITLLHSSVALNNKVLLGLGFADMVYMAGGFEGFTR